MSAWQRRRKIHAVFKMAYLLMEIVFVYESFFSELSRLCFVICFSEKVVLYLNELEIEGM